MSLVDELIARVLQIPAWRLKHANDWVEVNIAELHALVSAAMEVRGVPREPTEAMVPAGYHASSDEKRYFIDRLPDYWRAMWDQWTRDAAPAIPKGDADGVVSTGGSGASTPATWLEAPAVEAAGDAVPVALTDEQCDAIARSVGVMRVVDGFKLEPIQHIHKLRALIRAGYTAAPAKGDTPSVVRDALRELVECERLRDLAYRMFPHSLQDVSWADQMSADTRRKAEAINRTRFAAAWHAARAALAPAGEPNGQKNE